MVRMGNVVSIFNHLLLFFDTGYDSFTASQSINGVMVPLHVY